MQLPILNAEGGLSAPDESAAKDAPETTEPESQNEQDQDEAKSDEGAREDGEGSAVEKPDKAAAEGKPKAAADDDEDPDKETKNQRKRRMRREREDALRRELDAEQRRAGALQKRIEALKDTDPNAADNYEAAVAQNTVNKTLRTQSEAELADAKARTEQVKAEADAAKAEAWNERVAEVSHISDFRERVYAPDVPFTTEIAGAVMELDRGPEVAYHLATHAEELRALQKLSPFQLGVALGRMESSLSLPKPNLKSKAPAPLKTLKDTPTEGTFDPEKASYSEYRKHYGLD